jgi:hypothetical protein
MRITISTVAVCVFLTGCAASPRQRPISAGPVEFNANSLEATRRQLAGTWMLTKLEALDQAGHLVPIKAKAQLTYDEFGNLTIAATLDEPMPGQKSVGEASNLDYKGRATIDVARHELVFTGNSTAAPDAGTLKAIALESRRKYDLNGQTLTLSTMDQNGKIVMRTTYRK